MGRKKFESGRAVGDLCRRSRRKAIDASDAKLSATLIGGNVESGLKESERRRNRKGKFSKVSLSPVQQICIMKDASPM